MATAIASWQPSAERLEGIRRASAGTVRETPVLSLGALSRLRGGAIAVKAENLQRTGSFKLRGTLAKLLAADRGSISGVVAGSAGNHGQALAYAARAAGLPCTVFMPSSAALSKVEAVAAFGATVRQQGGSIDECVEVARQLAEREGLLFVHPFNDLEIVEGQAGVGLELLAQVPDLSRVVVPVGGGGLISGIAAAIKPLRPEVELIGVQAGGCAPFLASLRAGGPVAVGSAATIADGIAVKRPGDLTLALVERWVDDLVTVEDEAIAAAMVLMVERGKLVVEGAGAAAVAALASGAAAPAESGTTVAVLSGGNVDAQVLAAVLNRHQTGIGRRTRFFTRISDRPGGLASLLQTVAAAGGNLLEVTHVRDGVVLGLEETGVEVSLESRGEAHRRDLLERLHAAGYSIQELG